MQPIERIQNLLALSTSPNENEAKAALAKAQKLMIQHNITMVEGAVYSVQRFFRGFWGFGFAAMNEFGWRFAVVV